MEVEPVRDMKDVRRMYDWLGENYTAREAELWLIGCNVALRVSDLRRIRFDQVEGCKRVELTEQKTKKRKVFPITDVVREAVARLRAYYSNGTHYPTKPGWKPTYIFQSTSNRTFHLDQPISIAWVCEVLKKASRALEFDFNVNSHSMRKTFGYHAYTRGEDIHYIQALMNHAHSRVTLKYIGVTKTTIEKMYHTNSIKIA